MTAIQEHSIDLSAETDVAVVKIFLLLLKHVGKLIDLLLKHYYFLSQVCIVVAAHVTHATRVH